MSKIKVPKLMSEYYISTSPKVFICKFIGGPLCGMQRSFDPALLKEELYVLKTNNELFPEAVKPDKIKNKFIGVYRLDFKEYSLRLEAAAEAYRSDPRLKDVNINNSNLQHMLNYLWEGMGYCVKEKRMHYSKTDQIEAFAEFYNRPFIRVKDKMSYIDWLGSLPKWHDSPTDLNSLEKDICKSDANLEERYLKLLFKNLGVSFKRKPSNRGILKILQCPRSLRINCLYKTLVD